MAAGVSAYLIYHFSPSLRPIGPVFHDIVSDGQRIMIAIMLFLQFVKISPSDMRFRRWHIKALLFQILTFGSFSAVAAFTPEGEIRILLECALICLICPTAAASGVITEKLGGNIAGNVTYLVMSNVAATLLIPAVIPAIHPSGSLGFWAYVGSISMRIFPLLILPCVLAWIIRYTLPKLQKWLFSIAYVSFYIWGVSLSFAMILATRALLLSHISLATVMCIVLVSMGSCAIQFAWGRHIGHNPAEKITAGQSLGQKNTGFLIWLGYTYLTPVTSVAGGLYAIWQNLFNSWELHEKRHDKL